ncbi:hypothetical protein GCM10011390_07220 [Aureimonas endophytica]|uniref:Lipoprotein n=1 Tax=Aureimonas endophytica TaxID=2027858 RepID=A0A916ZE20_9HYPH|nr:hypothetical protein [Aureimonas endophytica]GGD91067.1 hypothetical protein GCM10011390_07220 [Aureimonas endophytica]
MKRLTTIFLAVVALLGSACSTARQSPPPPRAQSALDRMERVALAANRCWFRSKDPAFSGYSLAPELSSFSGRPRILLVPKGRPEAKPLLVVEGRDGSSEIATYGPVMDGALAARVSGDIRRWNGGATGCSA